jgi:hypothetical protein
VRKRTRTKYVVAVFGPVDEYMTALPNHNLSVVMVVSLNNSGGYLCITANWVSKRYRSFGGVP